MALLLLVVAFGGIFCSIGANYKPAGKRHLLLLSVIFFALLLGVMTELLGYFRLISFQSLFFCWGIIDLTLICYLYFKKNQSALFINDTRRRMSYILHRLTIYEKILLSVIVLLMLLVFIQGIAYPPNNRDSLTYHMARIPSWISHHSVDAYPTHILRQVYQPPLAEYIILHVNLLSHSDYFSASVQFFFFIFCAVAISAIIKSFGLGRGCQVAGFILALTLPEGVLQASSTQNDLVVAFFVLCACYFCFRAMKGPRLSNYLVLGCCTGLAIYTKGTAYMYLAPVLLIFGIDLLVKVFKLKKPLYLFSAFLGIVVLPVLINAPQYYRNYSFSGNLLGIDKNEAKFYSVERMDPKLFLCNTLKNADLHMGLLCVPRITFAAGKVVHKVFEWTNVNLDDTTITYPTVRGVPGDPIYYSGRLVATHEDFAPNFVHFSLLLFSLTVALAALFKGKRHWPALLLAISVIAVILIFGGYLKWQTIETRLQTGIFLMGIPVVCYACTVNSLFRKAVFRFALPFCILYALLVSVFNFTRPYITHYRVVHAYTLTAPTAITLDRYKKMFSGIEILATCKQYRDIKDSILRHNYKNIGLIISYNDWEYPLFVDCYTRELNPVHINVTNYTKNIKGYNLPVDCIVSTTTNKPFIDYMGRRFYNQAFKNTVLWYYRPL